jgi:hypothetical protein
MGTNLLAKIFGTDTTGQVAAHSEDYSAHNIGFLNTSIYEPTFSKEQPTQLEKTKLHISRGCFIKVNPFSVEYKELVMRYVIDTGNTYRYFAGNLSLNFFKEQGFDLPLTNNWLAEIKDNITYHTGRHILFVQKNNMIIGLRCKDNINYWTSDEKFKIQQLVDIASSFYKMKGKYELPSTPSYIPGVSNYLIPPPTTKYDNEIDADETNYFLDKILKSIENDSDFSKIKKFTKKLKSKDGFKIIFNILKQYMKLKQITWYDIRDKAYDIKYFIRDKLLKK